MGKLIIVITEDGEVLVVKRRKGKKHKGEKAKIIIPLPIIHQMEIRVESVFRPGVEDVETSYALTGNSVMEMLHKFTSKEVIKEATPFEVHTKTEAKIKYILDERAEVGKASTVIDVHTHPGGLPVPSEQDLVVFKRAYTVYSKYFENVYFGVHAISLEQKLRRTKPIAEKNKIKWNSLNRKHEVAFFDKDGKEVEVTIWMR